MSEHEHEWEYFPGTGLIPDRWNCFGCSTQTFKRPVPPMTREPEKETKMTLVNKYDPEDCEACGEDGLCDWHEGVMAGYRLAIANLIVSDEPNLPVNWGQWVRDGGERPR